MTFVVFDTFGGTDAAGYTQHLFAGVFGNGIYRSTDGGATWTSIGGPARPLQGKPDGLGNLYVTHTNGVQKWNGADWSNITPAGLTTQFSGLDISRTNPNVIIVAQRVGGAGNRVYLSTDGGATWSDNKAGNRVSSVGWWPANWHGNAIAAARFAPTADHPNRVWFTDWFGMWSTNDITPASPFWNNFQQGHEELVMHTIRAVSPIGSSSAIIYTGAADIGGLRHRNLDTFPTADDKLSGNQDMNSIDVFEGDNQIVYRVGNNRGNTTNGNGWKSTDGGNTWTVFNASVSSGLPETARGGRIAISATDPNLIVWLPFDNLPHVSTDGGQSWTQSTGVTSTNFFLNNFEPNISLASNKYGSNRFYVYKPDIGFYVSNSGATAGASFTSMPGNGLPSFTGWSASNRYGVKTVPNQDGGVWVNLDGPSNSGIYVSTNFGTTFTRLAGVRSAQHVAFGAPAPGSTQPATVFMFGRLDADAQSWVYRSDDLGATWTRVNDPNVQFGSGVKTMDADRKVYGRVYVGTSGRSVFYGQIEQVTTDVTAQVSVAATGFRLNRATGRFAQTLTVTHTGTEPIAGPVSLVFDALSANATLHAPTGTTTANAPLGSPFFDLDLGADATLTPGEAVTLIVEFANATNQPITYTTRVLAGDGTR